MMASEYKKRGGSYTTDKDQQDESQKNLSEWGEEDWQTKEGSGNAKQDDGSEKRYLPKKAWEKMSEGEKEETEEKKLQGSKEGKQHVGNTGKAKESRKEASKSNGKQNGGDEDEEGAEDRDEDEEDDGADGEENETQDEDGAGDDKEGEEKNDSKANTGQKRKKGSKSNGTSSKKQKDNAGKGQSNGTIGSKHMSAEQPAPRGSAERLPKQGQKATWKAMPGYVDGEVVEVLKQDKNVDGKKVKASEKDPKIVLKSSSSGKICVHKPDACFYEDA